MFLRLQQEIGDVAAAAQRKFYERYPHPEDWTSKRIDSIVGSAVSKIKVHFRSELRKMLPVADPVHTKDFLAQVKAHYEGHDESPEMKLEKLWMLGTCAMEPSMKVFWLERWNQPPPQRVQLKFPKLGFSDAVFGEWLHKATWWAQVSKNLTRVFILCTASIIIFTPKFPNVLSINDPFLFITCS